MEIIFRDDNNSIDSRLVRYPIDEGTFGGSRGWNVDFVRVSFFFFFLSFYASLKEERHDEARLRCNYGPFQAHASDGGKSGSPTAMLLGWDKGQFLRTVMTVNKFIPFRLYNKLILGLGR